MGTTLELLQIEAAINRLRTAQPPVDGVLPAALSRLADVYARMIYFRQARIEVGTLAPDCQALLARWADRTVDAEPEDGCEVCQ